VAQQRCDALSSRFMGEDHLLACPVLQGEAVAEVASIWNCKNSVAKTLLMHYMWDKDKLMSECWLVADQTQAAHKPSAGAPCSCTPSLRWYHLPSNWTLCLHSNTCLCVCDGIRHAKLYWYCSR
jgi:hypothetical protein